MATAGRTVAAEIAVPAILLALSLATVPAQELWAPVAREVDALGLALIAVAALATVVRRRLPAVTLVVAALSVAAYLVLGYPYGFILLSLAVAVYSVARRLPLRRAAALAAGALAVLLVHLLTNDAALPGFLGLAPASAWIVVPFSAGVARRLLVEARERERAETERRRLDEERLRIAHEVHDVVGHGLAAIRMQADIARHVGDADPEQARRALEAISSASADALAELRATLGTITPEAERAPTPGLDRLPELCDRIRAAGVAVQLDVVGDTRRLPTAVDVAAYRILQEALTNVVKHADERRARVNVHYSPDAVDLAVESRGTPRSGEGFGIAGMRRRASDVGGTIDVAARDGRFAVSAHLPARA